MERVGFFGILACASIPNPLFDLAGITCGHFLVPFWTFFGATLIGKVSVIVAGQGVIHAYMIKHFRMSCQMRCFHGSKSEQLIGLQKH